MNMKQIVAFLTKKGFLVNKLNPFTIIKDSIMKVSVPWIPQSITTENY